MPDQENVEIFQALARVSYQSGGSELLDVKIFKLNQNPTWPANVIVMRKRSVGLHF